MEFSYVKIAVFTPLSHAKAVRKVLADAGAGHIGNYDSCCFSTFGTGRFRPLKGAKPFVGKEGELEEVEEERIEVICEYKELKFILHKLREVHPYEEPAIDVYPLMNKP